MAAGELVLSLGNGDGLDPAAAGAAVEPFLPTVSQTVAEPFSLGSPAVREFTFHVASFGSVPFASRRIRVK